MVSRLKTAGEMLREARRRKGMSVGEATGVTKIREEVIRAIEKSDFSRVTSFTVARGLIAAYAKSLNLAAEKVVAVFRRDFVVGPKGDILPRGLAYPLDKPRWLWGPRLAVVVVAVVVTAGLGAYLGYQYWRVHFPPPLEVMTPAEGAVVGKRVVVRGKTRPDTQVRVNMRGVVVGEEGEFEAELALPAGENQIEVEAVNRAGKMTVVERHVRVEEGDGGG